MRCALEIKPLREAVLEFPSSAQTWWAQLEELCPDLPLNVREMHVVCDRRKPIKGVNEAAEAGPFWFYLPTPSVGGLSLMVATALSAGDPYLPAVEALAALIRAGVAAEERAAFQQVLHEAQTLKATIRRIEHAMGIPIGAATRLELIAALMGETREWDWENDVTVPKRDLYADIYELTWSEGRCWRAATLLDRATRARRSDARSIHSMRVR